MSVTALPNNCLNNRLFWNNNYCCNCLVKIIIIYNINDIFLLINSLSYIDNKITLLFNLANLQLKCMLSFLY